jgi:hypothetical protein
VGYLLVEQSEKANPYGLAFSLGIYGAGERNRTLDLRITSALLYQLSYTGPATRPPAPPCLHGKTGYAWTGKAGLLYP